MKESMPQNLGEWAEKQYQKPEILQRELLKEQGKNILVENHLKSLLELFSQVDLDKHTSKSVTPLNPYLEANFMTSQEHTQNQKITTQEIQEKMTKIPSFIPYVTKELICEYKKKCLTGTECTQLFYVKKADQKQTEFLVEKTDTTWFGKDYSILVDDIFTAKEIFKDLARG